MIVTVHKPSLANQKPAFIETPIGWKRAVSVALGVVLYLICLYLGAITLRGIWLMWSGR